MLSEGNKDYSNNPLLSTIKPLEKTLGVDFVTYACYYEDRVEFYSSSIFNDEIDTFIRDAKSVLPESVTSKTSSLSWRDYCSEEFIYRCKYLYNYNPDGVALYLKHQNFAEHISLGTTDLSLNIAEILKNDSQLKQQVVNFIRSEINFNKGQYQPLCYDRRNIKQSQPNYTQDSLSNIQDRVKQNKVFIFGNTGPTHITAIEKICLEYTLQLLTADQIAEKLCLSSKTVESHIANVKKRLGAKTRHALYKVGKKNNLI